MDRKLDGWVAARALIDKFGRSATAEAKRRARLHRAAGRAEAAEIWQLVQKAIQDLQGLTPEAGEGEERQGPLTTRASLS